MADAPADLTVNYGTEVRPEIYPNVPPPTPPSDDISAVGSSELTVQRGRSGTLIPSGYIVDEDYNSIWDSRERFSVIEEMRRSDATVAASLEVCEQPILAAEWDVESVSDDEEDILVADFIKHNLFERISFFDFMRQALTYRPFGFSTFEKVYEVIDWNGKEYVGLSKLQFMKQWTVLKWQTPSGNLGITQMLKSGPSNIPVPWWKMVVFTNKREGDNYMGISCLRPVYKHFDIKKKLYLIDALKQEKQGLGILKLTTPAGASDADLRASRDVARNMRANKEAYVDMPDGFDIEFLDMKIATTSDAWPTIAHHNREIFLASLSQFLDLGSGGAHGSSGGSHSLSTDQTKLFQLSLESIAKTMAETIYTMVITDLVKLNFPGKQPPKLVFGKFNDDNIEVLSAAINSLMTVEALHADPNLEEWIRKIMHMPDLPDALKDKLNEKMLDIDKTPPVIINNNSGEDLEQFDDVDRVKGQPAVQEDTFDTSMTKDDGDQPDQGEKPDKVTPKVEASETIADIKAFRTYLDARIREMK